MAIRDLLPTIRTRKSLPMGRGDGDPFETLREDMNQLFDRLWADWGVTPFRPAPLTESDFSPRLDISESDEAIRVRAELPGMEEKDVDVTLSDDTLTLEGEKHEEHEEKERERSYRERRYGRFRRDIPLPVEVDADKVQAQFDKGVLTITLPKTHAEQEKRRRIEVKTPA